jgi:hypothetical protein
VHICHHMQLACARIILALARMQVLGQQAYILFYSRRSPRKVAGAAGPADKAGSSPGAQQQQKVSWLRGSNQEAC